MKILINALSGIGDALMFSPALEILKANESGAQVDMLVMFSSVKDMYSYSPHLQNIYFIDFLHQSKRKSIKEIREIRKNKYDVIINTYPSNRWEYNFLSFMLGGKKRIAHHYSNSNLFRLEFLNTKLADEKPNLHNVLQNVNLLRKIAKYNIEEVPGTKVYISEEIQMKNELWVKSEIKNGKKVIGFHAGSSVLKNHIHKRWSKENYIELGKKLIEQDNAFILLFGSEKDLNSEIKESLGENSIIASTSNYLDSLARMKYCSVFVSNDTAFMHSAAAFNIPVVAIFGYTNYKELYPWGSKYKIIRKELYCSPCFFNSPKPVNCSRVETEKFLCINSISIEEVYNAVKEI